MSKNYTKIDDTSLGNSWTQVPASTGSRIMREACTLSPTQFTVLGGFSYYEDTTCVTEEAKSTGTTPLEDGWQQLVTADTASGDGFQPPETAFDLDHGIQHATQDNSTTLQRKRSRISSQNLKSRANRSAKRTILFKSERRLEEPSGTREATRAMPSRKMLLTRLILGLDGLEDKK